MNIAIKTWVEPITVSGNGIPFSPRTMYAVKQSIGTETTHFPSAFPAYWSRSVANRVAEENCRALQRYGAAWLDGLLAGG